MLKTRPQRILIADNDEEVLLSLERLLEDCGYATTTAVSHAEASHLLSQGRFDLYVLDDFLSDKDSVAALSELRQSRALLPVIVTYQRFPRRSQEQQLRALGVLALVHKRAHIQLAQIVFEALRARPLRSRL